MLTFVITCRRFGGYAAADAVAREAKELAELIRSSGETDVDLTRYYVAGYDPPFKPLARRNEVWFVKLPKEGVAPTGPVSPLDPISPLDTVSPLDPVSPLDQASPVDPVSLTDAVAQNNAVTLGDVETMSGDAVIPSDDVASKPDALKNIIANNTCHS